MFIFYYLPFFLLVVFTSSSRAPNGWHKNSNYQLVLTDTFLMDGIIGERKTINETYCASYCMTVTNCDGFEFDRDQTCSLLRINIEERDICSYRRCHKRVGSNVYLEVSEVVDVNSQGNSVSYRNGMKFSRIPSEITVTKIDCKDNFLQGFFTDNFSFTENQKFIVVCGFLNYNTDPEEALSFPPNTNAQCKTRNDVITGLEFSVVDNAFETTTITCSKAEEGFFKADSKEETVETGRDRSVGCRQGFAVVAVKPVIRGPLHLFELKCRQYKKN